MQILKIFYLKHFSAQQFRPGMPSLFPRHPQVLQPRMINRAESLKTILLFCETKCYYAAEAAFGILLPLPPTFKGLGLQAHPAPILSLLKNKK